MFKNNRAAAITVRVGGQGPTLLGRWQFLGESLEHISMGSCESVLGAVLLG